MRQSRHRCLAPSEKEVRDGPGGREHPAETEASDDMATRLVNTIDICCTPETVYGYVTQPWRWHEWHPSSVWASSDSDALKVGDSFEEEIALQPLSPLPFRMRRQTRYTVRVAEPFRTWEVRGETTDGWLIIRYDLEPGASGTAFSRTLTYQTSGPSRLLMPVLKKRMINISSLALARLKSTLESSDGASARASGEQKGSDTESL